MKIDFTKLQYQYQLYKEEIDQAIYGVLDKSNYIMGNEVTEGVQNSDDEISTISNSF